MSTLGKYVGRTIFWMIILSCFALLSIIILFTLLDELSRLENNYQQKEALMFVLYSIPGRFYDMLPFGILIGCLTGLGILASNSELVVMQTSGVSTFQISMNVIKPVILLLILNIYLGEYVVPNMERVARNDKQLAVSKERKLSRHGFWFREGNIYMHVSLLNTGGVIQGVTHYIFNESRQLEKVLYARRAVFHTGGSRGPYWLLEDIEVTEFTIDGPKAYRLPGLEWKTSIRPDIAANESLLDPVNLSVRELTRRIDYLREQELDSTSYELGFWKKVLQPLSVIGLVFIALSFIFGPLRETTMGVRVVSGIVTGIFFKFSQDLLSPASVVYGFSPLLAVLVPILLCFLAGLYLLKRAA